MAGSRGRALLLAGLALLLLAGSAFAVTPRVRSGAPARAHTAHAAAAELAHAPRLAQATADCKPEDKRIKTLAIVLQGYLGFVGAGAFYIEEPALVIQSIASSVLFFVGVAFMVWGARQTPAPKARSDSASTTSSMSSVAPPTPPPSATSRAGLVIAGIGGFVGCVSWLVGLAAIYSDYIMPTNGCGWA